MNDCWANCLGDCSDKISKEHIITAGLFLDDKIIVQGLPWCKSEPKEIGLASFTKKNLCTTHNGELSVTDSAAISSINVLRDATHLSNLRIKHNITHPTIKRFKIDGPALERWFLKTFINVAYKQAYPIGNESAQPWLPSRDLVEIAFGRNQFAPKAGLYFLGDPGEQIISNERLRVVTLANRDGVLVGAMFYLRGFRFLLFVEKTGPAEQVDLVGVAGISGPSTSCYHLTKIRVKLGNQLSHVIEIHW
jgi:hypothetical protein